MLTKDLELPTKKIENKKWESKQLFPFREAISIIKKKSNIYEIFSFFMVTVSALGELFKVHLSIMWYILTSLVLLESLYLRTIFNKEETLNKVSKRLRRKNSMRDEYSKREVDMIKEGIHEKLDQIIAQTTKTNGRVNRLENWKGFITGGVAVIAILIVPLLVNLFK